MNLTTRSRFLFIFVQVITLAVITCVPFSSALAQTSGGTTISNQATSTYSDGSAPYSTASNTVTVTVSNVSGLTITPDGAALGSTVVPGQTGVIYSFRITNTGNITDQVRFKASGASIRMQGSAAAASSMTAAVIDVDGSGTINAGDTDVLGNGSDVDSANIVQNGFIDVLVRVTVGASATAGQTIKVILGDVPDSAGAPFDNQAFDDSTNEVSTVSTASVNGRREARGDLTGTVANDAQLRLVLTAPSGPVALGSDISYTYRLYNDGNRAADPAALSVSGSDYPGVYIVAPIPLNTVLKSGQSMPTGTLYTTDPLTTDPLSAEWIVWNNVAPPTLSNVKRVAFKVGASLAPAADSGDVTLQVTINSVINASIPIQAIGDAFAHNSIGSGITDQSGDTVINVGDGNANFDEGTTGDNDGDGRIQETTLSLVGDVLVGPQGQAGATSSSNNDDYTNKSVSNGIAGVAPTGTTTIGDTLLFVNTISNIGNGNDSYTISAPTVPTGFTVEVSTTGAGGTYTTISGGGSTTVAISYASQANIHVRITAPSGKTVLTAYPTTVRVASVNTPATYNETINRVYTGFVRLDASQAVSNGTGVGSSTDPVPGAEIVYTLNFTNVSSSGGSNNTTLTASNIAISNPRPANTDLKVGSAVNSPPAGISVAVAYSNDNGSTWTYTPTSGGGGAPAGYDRAATHVRFTLTGNLNPGGATGSSGFTTRIR